LIVWQEIKDKQASSNWPLVYHT